MIVDPQELAQRILEKPAIEQRNLLKEAGFVQKGSSQQRKPHGPPAISIWTPQQEGEDVVYRRPKRGLLGDHFAAQQEFNLRKTAGTQRVCWFGESAAAGYLFAPYITPAKCLAHQLGSTFEVIDLARTNETIANMAQTMASACTLEADVWVVYTGNNWNLLESGPASPYTPQAEARFNAAEQLAKGGVAQLVEDAAYRWYQNASALMLQLSQWALEHAFRVILIGPAVNKVHWQSWQPPHRFSEEYEGWWQQFEAAQIALADNQPAAARTIALMMLKSSDWLNPTAYDLYAQALSQLEDAKAQQAYMATIDQAHGVTAAHLDSPRAGTITLTLLETSAKQYGFDWLDLRDLLHDSHEHFADYCHLTPQAMQLLAKALAEKLSDAPTTEQFAADPPALATGYLGAAIHGAHRYLGNRKTDWICNWLERAIRADPRIGERILHLAAMRLAGGDALLHPAQQLNFAEPYPLEQQHGWRYPHVDAVLLQCIERVLARKANKEWQRWQTMVKNAQWLSGQTNLLRYWLWEPLEQILPELVDYADLDFHNHLTCVWPHTSFALLLKPGSTAQLCISWRTPETGQGQIRITLENQTVAELDTSQNWQYVALPLSCDHLPNQLQRLNIHWPMPQPQSMTNTIEHLRHNRDAYLHPVFGQLSRCDVIVKETL